MWFIRKKKIGIIGYGNMGSAIAQRLKGKFLVYVFDKDLTKTDKAGGVNVYADLASLIQKADIIILAIKPQDFAGLLNEIKDRVSNKLIVSIAAGISTEYIEGVLGKVRVVRVMPNLPAQIGQGMSCLCKGRFASAGDLRFVQQLFHEVGQTMVIAEKMMDAATAISGSGPGFWGYQAATAGKSWDDKKFFTDFVFDLEKVALAEGFSREQAMLLAAATAGGTVAYLKNTALSAQELTSLVASPGGTTEAGLGVLRKGGTLQEAVKAARKKAQELSKRSG